MDPGTRQNNTEELSPFARLITECSIHPEHSPRLQDGGLVRANKFRQDFKLKTAAVYGL